MQAVNLSVLFFFPPLWNEPPNFEASFLPRDFHVAYYWTIWGFHWLEEGDRSSWLLLPPWQADGNWRRKAELEKVNYQTSPGGGESWTWEEDLGVFLSLLPVSPGSVTQRFSGKGVVMANWLFPSWLYGDKCPRGILAVPVLQGGRGQSLQASHHGGRRADKVCHERTDYSMWQGLKPRMPQSLVSTN